MITSSTAWHGRSVWVSGHTGFKGGWLAHWLDVLGAQVHGYALNPVLDPNLFDAARVDKVLHSDTRADVRDLSALTKNLQDTQPEILFHLAAQPIVREGYRNPLETFSVNTLGTANVLEAARNVASIRAIIVITTDKVYEDRGEKRPFTEEDPLGGRDPYSASKAAAELVTNCFRTSYFSDALEQRTVNVATARAGNVIGGGDWSHDRLIPDCVRAFQKSEPVRLRLPHAIRPWQHVLEPLSGYLKLADRLLGPDGASFARSWNFGPNTDSDAKVHQVAELAAQFWGQSAEIECLTVTEGPHETEMLRLDNRRARSELSWKPRWSLAQSVEETMQWYNAWMERADMGVFSRAQIRSYMEQEPYE